MKRKVQNSAKTVLVISVGFSLIYFLLGVKWALNVSLVIGVLGIISEKFCDFIDYLWMKFTDILGLIMPNILLSIVFYLFLFPLAVLSRIFKSSSPLKLKNEEESFWVSKTTKIDKTSFEKMW